MTREDAKKLVPIMQAYAEGKTIQYQTGDGMWMNMSNVVAFSDIADHYRVKPEPKYRPFKSKTECWNEMKKHEPFGWVKDDYEGIYCNVVVVSNDVIYTSDNDIHDYDEAFENLKFIDGTPFGIKE